MSMSSVLDKHEVASVPKTDHKIRKSALNPGSCKRTQAVTRSTTAIPPAVATPASHGSSLLSDSCSQKNPLPAALATLLASRQPSAASPGSQRLQEALPPSPAGLLDPSLLARPQGAGYWSRCSQHIKTKPSVPIIDPLMSLVLVPDQDLTITSTEAIAA